jgi:hypothetical protein
MWLLLQGVFWLLSPALPDAAVGAIFVVAFTWYVPA